MNVIKDNGFAPRGRGRGRHRGRIGTLGGYDAQKTSLNVQPKYQLSAPQIPLRNQSYNASSSSTTTTPRNPRRRGCHLTSSSSSRSLSRCRTTDSEAGKCTTPGSRSDVEEKLSIMAITTGRGEARGEIGLAVMDIQYPHMVLCQLSDCNSFVNTLTKIYMFNPVEILLPDTICSDRHNLYNTIHSRFPGIAITGIPRMNFCDKTGLGRIRTHCAKEYSSVELIIGRKYYALAAASALTMYIEYIQRIQYLPRTMRIEYQVGQNTTMIDIESAQRLELVTTNGGKSNFCLLGAMDRCSTPLGRRVLRASILQPPCDVAIIRNRQKCIEELIGNRSLHEIIKSVISQLSGVHRLLSFTMRQLQSDSVTSAERNLNYILLLKSTVDIIPQLRAALDTAVAPFFVKVREDSEDDRFKVIERKILSIINPTARSVKGFTSSNMQRCFAIKSGINDMLDVTRQNYCEILDDMKKSVDKIAEKYHLPLSFGCTMALGYHIQLTVPRKDHFKAEDLPEEFIQVQKKWNTIYMTTESLVVLGKRCQEISEDLHTLSNELMEEVLSEITEFVACLFLLSDNVAELDLVLSLAEISSIPDYVKPTFGSSLKLFASKHPVMDILGDERPASNDVAASIPYNFHTITGPNMSGKTLYLKQIVLLHIMAQIGCYVPATKAQFRIADRILCVIEVRDDIEMDASTFILEIKKIQYIQQSITPTSLVILDELCRSTTVEEGSSIAWVICKELAKTQAFTFHATHFQFLLHLPKLYPNIVNHYMEVLTNNIDENRLTYTHQRKEGVSNVEHYGIALARVTGFPAEILKNAEELLTSLDSSTLESEWKFSSEADRLQAEENKWNHDCLAAMYEELEKEPAEVNSDLLIDLIKKLKVPPESADAPDEILEPETPPTAPKTPVKKSITSVFKTVETKQTSKRILQTPVCTEPKKKLIKVSSTQVDIPRQPFKAIENNETLSQKTSSQKTFQYTKNPLTDPDSPLFMPPLPPRNSKTPQATFVKPDKPPPRSWSQVSRKSDVCSQSSKAPHNFSPYQQNVSTPTRTCTQTSSSLGQNNRDKTSATSSINVFKKHQDSTNRESAPFVQISPELSHIRHILKKYAEEPQPTSTSKDWYEPGALFFARSDVVTRPSTSTQPSGSQIDNFNINQQSRVSIKSPDVSVSSEMSAIASGSSFQLDEYVPTPNSSFNTPSSHMEIDLVSPVNSFSSMDSVLASKEARRKEAEIFKKIEGSDFDEKHFLHFTTTSYVSLSSDDLN